MVLLERITFDNDKCDDLILISVLEIVELKLNTTNFPINLDTDLGENGSEFQAVRSKG